MAGPWIIITGGNRGLGLEMAQKLVENKRPVIITARDEKKGKGVASILGKQTGDTSLVQSLQLDVDHSDSLDKFINTVNSQFKGRIHALINNAGVYPTGWNNELFQSTKLTNFDGPVKLCLGIAPAIQKGGRIVNVTSGLGRIERLKRTFQDQINQANTLEELGLINSGGSEPGSSSYTPTYDVSKAMLNKATQIMSKLPEFQHIAINAASPGWCRTEMGGKHAPRSPLQGRDSILSVLDLPENETGGIHYVT